MMCYDIPLTPIFLFFISYFYGFQSQYHLFFHLCFGCVPRGKSPFIWLPLVGYGQCAGERREVNSCKCDVNVLLDLYPLRLLNRSQIPSRPETGSEEKEFLSLLQLSILNMRKQPRLESNHRVNTFTDSWKGNVGNSSGKVFSKLGYLRNKFINRN